MAPLYAIPIIKMAGQLNNEFRYKRQLPIVKEQADKGNSYVYSVLCSHHKSGPEILRIYKSLAIASSSTHLTYFNYRQKTGDDSKIEYKFDEQTLSVETRSF